VNPTGRWAPHKLAAGFVAAPSAPPDAHADRVVYGLAQPLLGARMLFADRALLRAALVPAGLLALFCAGVALLDPESWSVRGVLHRFYYTFAVLAPLPSVLLASHYARQAALARDKFGFGPVQPCIEPLGRAVKRMIAQALLVAIGLVPLSVALQIIPFVGALLLRAAVAVWALHWIVVDAFDSARVLQPGQTLADLDRLAEEAPRPWFVRLLGEAGERIPGLGRLLGWFGRWCDRLARPWREEIVLVERHPSLMLGFALSTALLVATPVLNLLFRPIVLIGAAHVLGRLEHPATPPELPPPASPPPPPAPPP
jgi:hypothetical protein